MLSVQTNIASLTALENLRVNNEFQTKTIERLTSGYRINSSGDDAAGLVVANQYRSSIAELTQGVRNANDGISTLQIVDGGLNNISMMLDRMKTLATQSASGTFTGSRATLDQEYQQLIGEITRQANDIGVVSGGSNSQNISVYIGGAPQGVAQSYSTVQIDLAGVSVDATGLGLTNTSVDGADQGVRFAAAPDVRTGTYLATNTAQYVVHTANGTYTATIGGTGTAQNGADLVASLNQQIAGSGVSARINSTDGHVEFVGSAFSITSSGAGAASFSGTAGTITNDALYEQNNLAYATSVNAQTLTFTMGGSTTNVNIAAGVTAAGAANAINQTMNSHGVYAFVDSAGNLDIQGNGAFSTSTTAVAGDGGFDGVALGAATAPTITGSGTQAASSAILSVDNAIQLLGNVQGTVGSGENKLNYAVDLAQSQISSFSAAQSRIRDADMAAEAANLTKAQVLQQASLAAMAQANAAPQAVLALLK
jgi:flagellin